jgi:hypothetical protein
MSLVVTLSVFEQQGIVAALEVAAIKVKSVKIRKSLKICRMAVIMPSLQGFANKYISGMQQIYLRYA